MKKIQLSLGFEIHSVSPSLHQYIQELESHLNDVFALGGAKVVDSKSNVEILDKPREKSLLQLVLPSPYNNYTSYPLNINGVNKVVLVHKDNTRTGKDYPTIDGITAAVERELPKFKNQDRIHQVLFYHGSVFINIPDSRKNKFIVIFDEIEIPFRTLSSMEQFIDSDSE